MDVEGLEHPDKWAVETFGTTELGDLRRTDRLVKMATAIAENPSASLPESMRNWADTLAAYRFLDNETITHEQIMQPHWMSTHQEAMQHPRVLLAADTTDVNLSSHETAEGLGPIGRGNKAQGFFVHTVLAMDADSRASAWLSVSRTLCPSTSPKRGNKGTAQKACARVADMGAQHPGHWTGSREAEVDLRGGPGERHLHVLADLRAIGI